MSLNRDSVTTSNGAQKFEEELLKEETDQHDDDVVYPRQEQLIKWEELN